MTAKPETPAELDWMLQDARVRDADLTANLAREYFSRLCRLAELLPAGASDKAGDRTLRSSVYCLLGGVVVGRGQFWGEQTFKRWLFDRAWQAWKPSSPRDFERIDLNELAALLVHDWAFSLQEAAALLDQDETQLMAGLKLSLAKLEAHADSAELSGAELAAICAEIDRCVQRERSLRQKKISFKEIWLLAGLLGVMAILAAGAKLLAPEVPEQIAIRAPTELVTQVVYMFITPTAVTLTPTPEWTDVYLVKSGDTLTSIALKTGVGLKDLREINRMPPGADVYSGQKVSLVWPGEAAPTLQAIRAEARTPVPFPEPLTAQSSPDEAIARARDTADYWNSIWYENIDYIYGPPGYVGAPVRWHIQGGSYSSDPYYWFVLTNISPGTNQPDFFETQLKDQYRFYEVPTGTSRVVGTNFKTVDWPGMPATDTARLFNPFPVPTLWIDQGEIKITGADLVAGRPAVVLEVTSPEGNQDSKVWLDAETGLLLRVQVLFDGVIYLEMTMLRVIYNADLPVVAEAAPGSRIYGFASDETGQPQAAGEQTNMPQPVLYPGHVPLEHISAPAGFDLASASLDFQWISWPGFGERGEIQPVIAEVFAGDYYLGQVESLVLGQISARGEDVCDRSPDGRLLAYVDVIGDRHVPVWFNLENVQPVVRTITGLPPTLTLEFRELAFSPDNRYLAALACRSSSSTCAVYLLDLRIGEYIRLLETGPDPFALTWSPDGRSLALVDGDYSRSKVMVVDSQSGEVIYSGAFEPTTGSVPPDSPTLSWGVPFPPPESNLACWEQ